MNEDFTDGVVLRWLVGLRWAVFALLAATLPLSERLFGYHVQYAIALPALGLATAVHLALARRVRARAEVGRPLLAPAAALDLVVIAVVLGASGGAGNPFSALFFVHVALAAALMPARATFALAGLAVCLFAALFALPSGACCPSHPEHGAFSTHLYGMLLAFLLSAGLVAYFLQRVRGALDAGAAENARLRRQAEATTRFHALGTLAAGTAHELGTPLGTIAVLAGEMSRDAAAGEDARRRARTIAEQVERCRVVIARMRSTPRVEGLRAGAEVRCAVERGVEAWRAAHPAVEVVVHAEPGASRTVALDAEDIEAALCALLDNALHATRSAGAGQGDGAGAPPIVVTVGQEGGAPVVSVEDAGAGVPSGLTGRLGEPFVTTKDPGEGMGLGLYLVRTLIEQVGGRLEISPRRPSGTRVALRLAPADR